MPQDQSARRRELYALLGDLPDRSRPVEAHRVFDERREKYVLEKLVLELNGVEHVPAYFVKPLDAPPGKRLPTVLYNHAHGGDYQTGKTELLEHRKYFQEPPYAEELTRRGYAALCIDHWVFGERSGPSESSVFKRMLWQGRGVWGGMGFDSPRGGGYLGTRGGGGAEGGGGRGPPLGGTVGGGVGG